MDPHTHDGLDREFSVRAARAAGATSGFLRSRHVERPFRGVRQRPLTRVERNAMDELDPWGRERAELMRRVRAYAEIMPEDSFFIGPTAAGVHGLPLPLGCQAMLWVAVRHPRTAPNRPGVRGVQILPHMVRVVERGGLRVADAASTWASLGGVLGAYDLTAVADAVIRRPRHAGRVERAPALADRDELHEVLTAGRRRGAAKLRSALENARDGASSRPESWARLILVDGGLPEPELDVDVFDDRGCFLGCSELAYPERRLAIEYESRGHLTPYQLRRDAEKYNDYQSAGWRIVRLTHAEVFTAPREAVRRTRALLRLP